MKGWGQISYQLSRIAIYFVIYSVLGWAMETVYCSVRERRFVMRGFLYGPLCPIYGIGVIMMVLLFRPIAGNLTLFYVVSTITMSAWEYFVAWALEGVTKIKYWDYSDRRFNLHGRICLTICLTWGVLSYVAIFWIHPAAERLVGLLSDKAVNIAAIVLMSAIAVDAAATVRDLALVSRMMYALERLGGELRVSLSPGNVEEKLHERYRELVSSAERRTRRLRSAYRKMQSKRFGTRLDEVRRYAAGISRVRAEIKHRRVTKGRGKNEK